MDDESRRPLLFALAVGVIVVVALFYFNVIPTNASSTGISSQLSVTYNDGSVRVYNPVFSPITQSIANFTKVTGLKLCSAFTTGSAYGAYLLSMSQSASVNGQQTATNSTKLTAYIPNTSGQKVLCISTPVSSSGTNSIVLSGSGFVAGLGSSSSAFQHFSQRILSVTVANGVVTSAAVSGIRDANSTTLICQSNCQTSTTLTSTSSTTTTSTSTRTTSTITGTSTSLPGIGSATLTSGTTNLVSAATSTNTSVISSTSLKDMGGASALTQPPNLVCLGSNGAVVSSGCYVWASTSTNYFYSQGIVGYNADGSPIYAYAQLGGVEFSCSLTWQTYSQLQQHGVYTGGCKALIN